MRKSTIGPDFLVGLFVLIGLTAIASLIVLLSGVTTADLGVTRITVKMESADGLIRGTKVMMSGVRIGRVIAHPDLTPDGRRAIIQVAIQQPFVVRKGSNFVVRPEGILGDRFVEVIPPDDPDAPALVDGDVAEGSRTTGLGDLAATAEELVDKIRPTLTTVQNATKRVDSILGKVDEQILTEDTVASLRSAIGELGSVVEKLNESIAGIGKVVENAQQASGSLRSALTRVDTELLDARTLDQLKSTIANLERTVASLQRFAQTLAQGEGVIGRLSTDKKLADDLAAFVQNLRERGILFYADVASREQQRAERSAARGSPQPTARPSPRR